MTLQDIAELSGVSKTTVSYVLNNKQTPMGISDATITRVLSVVDEVGYTGNKAAASLASLKKKKTKIIIVSPWISSTNFSNPHLSSHFVKELMRAFEEAKEKLEVEYLLFSANMLKKSLGNFKRFGAYDAVLLMGISSGDARYLKTISSEQRKNIILLNREVPGFTSVCTDDYAGGKLIASHALKRKKYKTYVLIVPKEASQAVGKRLKGISDIAEKSGIKLQRFTCGDWDEEDFEKVLSEYGHDNVMVFTFQDMMAIPFMTYLRNHGVDIPDQIGVSGYDAIDFSAHVSPALTTVDAKNYEISQKAVEMILVKNFPGKNFLIKPELIVRDSLK